MIRPDTKLQITVFQLSEDGSRPVRGITTFTTVEVASDGDFWDVVLNDALPAAEAMENGGAAPSADPDMEDGLPSWMKPYRRTH